MFECGEAPDAAQQPHHRGIYRLNGLNEREISLWYNNTIIISPMLLKLARRQLSKMIREGTRIPDFTFQSIKKDTSGACSSPFPVKSSELFGGKKVVLVAVPGAFTPVCSSQHLPGFIEKHGQLESKKVDLIACTSVNDPYVMGAWNDKLNGWGAITMLADGNGNFAKAIGADVDLSDKGMGVRSRRYVLVVDDGIVEYVGSDEGPLEKSSVDAVLKAL